MRLLNKPRAAGAGFSASNVERILDKGLLKGYFLFANQIWS